jgi:hypothetical protein
MKYSTMKAELEAAQARIAEMEKQLVRQDERFERGAQMVESRTFAAEVQLDLSGARLAPEWSSASPGVVHMLDNARDSIASQLFEAARGFIIQTRFERNFGPVGRPITVIQGELGLWRPRAGLPRARPVALPPITWRRFNEGPLPRETPPGGGR